MYMILYDIGGAVTEPPPGNFDPFDYQPTHFISLSRETLQHHLTKQGATFIGSKPVAHKSLQYAMYYTHNNTTYVIAKVRVL